MPHDLACALRQLRKGPGFVLAAVLTLALGIGANASIFQVLDALLFRPLPVRDPERLVRVQPLENGKPANFSYPVYRELAARQQVAEAIFATSDYPLHAAILRGRGAARTINVVLASGGYFDALGVAAGLGRVFTEADDRASAPVAVISEAFREREFGRTDAIGQILQINKSDVTVIGVAPAAFFGETVGNAPDAWVPMAMAPRLMASDWRNAPRATWLTVMARLRLNVPIREAQPAFDRLVREIDPERARRSDSRIVVEPAGRGTPGLEAQFERPVLVLMAAVGLVLLIACSNLATLLLGRAAARRHEMGVRLALGARRARLVRQLLVESCLLAAFGGAAALLVAQWGSRALVHLSAVNVPLDSNWRVLLFTGLVTVIATLLFGLAPALAATRVDIQAALQSARGRTGGPRRQIAGKALVVAQVSLSLLLLSGAGQLARSLGNLRHQHFGFRAENVLMADLPWEFSPTMMARYAAIRGPLFERLNSLPGVRSAALSCFGPMGGDQHTGPLAAPGVPALSTRIVHVSARYFETMGIPIVAGRGLTDDDRAGARKVAVLGETAARMLFGGANAIGRLVAGDKQFDAKTAIEVVGVARDVRFANPGDPFGVVLYVPIEQSPAPITAVVVRTAGDPSRAAAAVRAALHDVDRDLAISAIRPLADVVDAHLSQPRMLAMLSAAFGLLALALTSVGVYAVISYAVERRTHEIGIRLALGATRPEVQRMMLLELAAVVVPSLVLGGVGALAAARMLRALLFGIAPHDYSALLATCGVLVLVSAAAAWLPARRAARLDPMSALRVG
jgi:predicted permease